MGLLFFSHLCNPVYLTGAEKQLLLLLREMRHSRPCKLVVPNDGIIAAQARAEGIPVQIVPVPVVPVIYKSRPEPAAAISREQRGPAWRLLIRLLLDERPEAVVVNTSAHPLPAAAAKGLGIPVVWWVHEVLEQNEYTGQAAEILERHADLIVGASRTALRPWYASGKSGKTALLYPTWHRGEMEPEAWEPYRRQVREELGLADTHRLVAYITSAIYAGKGLDHFMRMAVAIAPQRPEAMFLVAGMPADDAYMAACLDMVRTADAELLARRFRFVTFEPHLARLYPAMDVVVVPSVVEEGFGLTAAEGMAFGKPVVSYASGGLSEIHEATGNEDLLVPVGDTEGLTAKVSALLNDPALLEEKQGRNAATAEAAFGIEAYRLRLEQLMARLPLKPPPARWLLRGRGRRLYVWQNGILRRFASEAAYRAAGHSAGEAVATTDAVLAALPAGGPIGRGRTMTGSGARRHRRRGRVGKTQGSGTPRPKSRRPLKKAAGRPREAARRVRAAAGRTRRGQAKRMPLTPIRSRRPRSRPARKAGRRRV